MALDQAGMGSQFFYIPKSSSKSNLDNYRDSFPPRFNDRLGEENLRFLVIDFYQISKGYYISDSGEKISYDVDLLAHELSHAAGLNNEYETPCLT